MKILVKIWGLLAVLAVFLSGCGVWFTNRVDGQNALFIGVTETNVDSVSDAPDFTDEPYVIINDNNPTFSDSDITTKSYEYYSPLDELGRCGYVIACVGPETMPSEERGEIGMINPTGWHTVKYDVVDGKYLYNCCHLIGFQLTGENANKNNLITGTRYLNIEGMLPFENLIADYIKETNNHVIYRVTPIFEGENLLASGVQMEGYSVEDNGEAICFNVYAYNSQPGVKIDYATGESSLTDDIEPETPKDEEPATYIINKSSKKFHVPSCSSVADMKPQNKTESNKSKNELIKLGYSPCKSCLGE